MKNKKKMSSFIISAAIVVAALAAAVSDPAERMQMTQATEDTSIPSCTSLPAAGAALSDLVYRKPGAVDIRCMELDKNDTYMLLKIAAAEAGTEDVTGKALVMRVVLNRVADRDFPDTVWEVVLQHQNSRYQFCTVKSGAYQEAEVTQECFEALGMVLSGWDESQGAAYFCTPEAAGKWHEGNLVYLFQHGNHRFYTTKEENAVER